MDKALDTSTDPQEVWNQLDHLAISSSSGFHGALIDQPLCERCAKIDFNDILDLSRIDPQEGRSVVWITSTEVRTCIFCRMLWVMGACRIANDIQRPSSATVFRSMELRAFRIPCEKSLPDFGRHGQVLLALGTGSFPRFLQRHTTEGHSADAYAAMMPILPHDHMITSFKHHSARKAILDYERIKGWIKECDKNHGKSCRTAYDGAPYTIKCIDCQTNAVVTIPITTKYFALSYVWGSPSQSGPRSQKQHQSSAHTLQDFPRTIRDAMTVVNRLGGRYLWVDQFCIDQENAAEKHKQISRMNDIYSSAWLTIITPANENSDTRVPGVSTARAEQLFVGGSHKLELRFGWNGVCLRTEICKTKWATRGWTYQEFVLSRRCLFLTSQRAHFVCNVGVRSEVDGERNLPPTDEGPFWKLGCLRKDKLFRGLSLFEVFRFHLGSYSERSLSFDSDSLNAFKGIIGHMRIKAIWGLPIGVELPNPKITNELISMSFALVLLHNICHKAGNGLTLAGSRVVFLHDRIDCMPSWSWAGWRGGKLAERFLWTTESEIEPKFDCTFQAQLKNGRRIAMVEYYSSQYNESHLSHSLFARGSCWTFQLRLIEKDFGRIWEIEDINTWQLRERDDVDYGAQIFWDTDDRDFDRRPSYEPYPIGDWQTTGDMVTCSGLCLVEYCQDLSSSIYRFLRFLLFVERHGKAYRIGVLQMRWDLKSPLENVWQQEKELKQRTVEFI